MKFEKIKVGDIVFIDKEIKTGKGDSFFIPVEVVNVTPTQFKLKDGTKCRKSDGKILGEYSCHVYKEGEKVSKFYGLSSRIVKNETNEMNKLLAKLLSIRSVNKLAEQINIPVGSELTINELATIKEKLKEVIDIIKSKQ